MTLHSSTINPSESNQMYCLRLQRGMASHSSNGRNLNTINEDFLAAEELEELEEEQDLSKSNSQVNWTRATWIWTVDLPALQHRSISAIPTILGASTARLTWTNLKNVCLASWATKANELSCTRNLDTEKSLFSPKSSQPNALSRQSFNCMEAICRWAAQTVNCSTWTCRFQMGRLLLVAHPRISSKQVHNRALQTRPTCQIQRNGCWRLWINSRALPRMPGKSAMTLTRSLKSLR